MGRIRFAEVYNNTIYMNQAPSGTHSALRIHNLSIESQDVESVHVRNNIFVVAGTTTLVSVTAAQLDGAIDLKIQGNAYYSQTGAFKILLGASTFTSITSFRNAGQEKNGASNTGFSGNPLLVSPGGGGTLGADNLANLTAYKLQDTSPVINTGLDLFALFGLSASSRDFWGRPFRKVPVMRSAPTKPMPAPGGGGGGGGGGSGGSIAGKVWNDANGNGVLDSGEVGVANITVYNDANNNSAKDSGELTAVTDSSGNYIFNGLGSGSYKIRQILQSGWSQTSPANGYGWTITSGYRPGAHR